jgi:outer membrane protein assembly factor BamB
MRKEALFTLLILTASTGVQAGENWPRFRGPTGQGRSGETDVPLTWTAETGVAWKTSIPGEGWSSPIVWGDRVFVTTATNGGVGCQILCLGAADGKILWNTHVFDQVLERKESKNSFATPTPCTDGERVYAVFGDGSAAALDFAGTVLWTNRDVQFYSRHGLGASPILYEGLLIMPYDGSVRMTQNGKPVDPPPNERLGWQIPWDRSELVALDTKTGRPVWTGKRGMSRHAHATPIVIQAAGRRGGRTLLVASPEADESGTVAANLAVALAQSGRRVILVCADLREASAQKHFCVANDIGLTGVVGAGGGKGGGRMVAEGKALCRGE